MEVFMNKKYLILSSFLLVVTMDNFAMLAQAKQWLSKHNWYQPTQSSTMTQSPTKLIDTTSVKSGYDSFIGALSSTLKRWTMPKQYAPRLQPKITYEAEAQNRLRELNELQQNPTDNSWSAWFGLGQNKQAISRGAAQTRERLQASIDQAGSSNPLIQKRLVELSTYEQPAITELEDIKIMSNPKEGAKGQLVVPMPNPRYIAHERTIVQDAEDARKRLIIDAHAFEHNPTLLDQAITLNKKWLKTKELYNAAALTNNEKVQSALEQRLSDIDGRRKLLLKHAPHQIKK